MGKHLWGKSSNDQFENNHPGCMWGILHALDYHHWHYIVKKILPHKKHNGRRHAKCNGSWKTRLNIHDSGEVHRLLDAETSHFLVDQGTQKTNSTSKRSLKARIKSLISEEMSKEEDHKQWGPMKSTDKLAACNKNVDYLEHSQLAENHTLFPEECNKARETLVGQKLVETKQLSGNASQYQIKEYKDILELLKVNRGLCFKTLQNADDSIAHCFHGLQTSNTKARLTKSGSFPVVASSGGRNFWPSKLEQKQNEIWSFRKREKLFAGTQAPVLVASKFPKDVYSKSGPLLNQEMSFSSLGSTQALDKNGSSEVVIDYLKDIKQRKECVVEGGGNENNLASLDELFSRVPFGCSPSTGGKEMAETERWKEGKLREHSSSSCHETDGSVCDLSEEKLTHISKTSSLNESMDKYARLFDYSFGREAKWSRSKSLKLTNEFHSLPHFVDNCINVENVRHGDQKSVSFPVCTENYVSLDSNEETERSNSMIKVTGGSTRMVYSSSLIVGVNDEETAKMDGISEEIDEITVGEINSQKEEEITSRGTAQKLPQQCLVSVSQSCFQEDVTTPAELPISEGVDCRCKYFDDKESSVNSQNRSNTDSLTWSCSTVDPENYENVNNIVKKQSHIELYTRDNADFNYVREIIERLGFNRNSFFRTWDLTDQPLKLSVFEEVETYWPHEPECSGEDICTCCCHHQLLFDLVIESLLQIHDRSFTYYPKALTFSSHIVLEEVWASISRSISLRKELEQSLDCVVAQALSKEDSWMNLQLEAECVALELEDWIFDKLLEEFICSLDC